MPGRTRVGMLVAVGGFVVGAFYGAEAVAGLAPMPLIAELDLAETVVVGKVAAIAKEREKNDGKTVVGTATVAVSEVLKGTETDELNMTVVMRRAAELSRAMASPRRIFRVGQKGILVLMPDGWPSHAYGLLPEQRRAEVQEALAVLKARVWSPEVQGLRAWSFAELRDGAHRRRVSGSVIFAVKNVSRRTRYLPLSHYEGIVSVVATDTQGKKHVLSGRRVDLPADRPLICRPLESGQTCYLHPDSENYGCFHIPKTLPPGAYTIRATLNNAADGLSGVR